MNMGSSREENTMVEEEGIGNCSSVESDISPDGGGLGSDVDVWTEGSTGEATGCATRERASRTEFGVTGVE